MRKPGVSKPARAEQPPPPSEFEDDCGLRTFVANGVGDDAAIGEISIAFSAAATFRGAVINRVENGGGNVALAGAIVIERFFGRKRWRFLRRLIEAMLEGADEEWGPHLYVLAEKAAEWSAALDEDYHNRAAVAKASAPGKRAPRRQKSKHGNAAGGTPTLPR